MTTLKNSRTRWSSMAGLLTVALLAGSVAAQDRPRRTGLPDDWSHRHLVFSNPGTYEQVVEQGVSAERFQDWLDLQQEARFKLQQAKRNRGHSSQDRDFSPEAATVPESESIQAGNASVADQALERELKTAQKAAEANSPPLRRDWNMKLGNKPPQSMFPAKFTFDINAAPDCQNDFVVFPIGLGAATVAKLIGFNNLYAPGLCGPAVVPTFKFAYQLAGQVQTSPVLSFDGTKIAFVESIAGGSRFHVLTIGTTGTNGSNTAGVPIGAAGGNNAVDTAVTMTLAASVTRSSPFVDYAADAAYVGDDAGRIHKFNNVFTGTMTEATAPWPVSVGAVTILTGPVAWNGSIFVGGGTGRLYCITTAGAACAIPSIAAGTTPIIDPPIVDGSTNQVFVTNETATNTVLVQAPTSLASSTTVLMGNPESAAGIDVHNGTFDHNYLTGANPSAGFMYICGAGVGTGIDVPVLYRVGFNATGQINATREPNSFTLGHNPNEQEECSPLTSIYNPTTPGGPTELLFVTMAETGHGCGSVNKACVGSLDITSAFPSAYRHTVVLGGSGQGTTAIVVDNVTDVVPTWLASTAYALNALIVDSNGNVQQCTSAGTSKTGSHPLWSAAVNTTTSDGTAVWTMRGPYRGSWQGNHAYSLNDVITDFTNSPTDTSHLQRVTTAGTSGATPPTFNTATGGTTTNGTVTWTNLGPYTPSGVASIYFADVASFLAYKFTQSELK